MSNILKRSFAQGDRSRGVVKIKDDAKKPKLMAWCEEQLKIATKEYTEREKESERTAELIRKSVEHNKAQQAKKSQSDLDKRIALDEAINQCTRAPSTDDLYVLHNLGKKAE